MTVAHSLSAKKRHRQNVKQRVINRARRHALKTQTRKLTDALSVKDLAAAEAEFQKLTKAIDQTRAKGTLHGNQAGRRKSRLQKRLNALRTVSA